MSDLSSRKEVTTIQANNAKYYDPFYQAAYRINNNEKRTMYQKSWRFNKDGSRTEKFDRSMKITNWKLAKSKNPIKLLPNETWNDLYDIYTKTTECMGCGKPFDSKNRKNLDHCHKTGFVRGVICNHCNHYSVDVFKHMF